MCSASPPPEPGGFPSRWLSGLTIAAGRHRLVTVVAVAAVSVLSVLVLPGLRLQASIYELFPHQPGPVADLAEYGMAFGVEHEVVTLVSGSDPAVVARAGRTTAAKLGSSPLLHSVRAGIEGAAIADALGPSLLLLAGDDAWPEVVRRLGGAMGPQVARLRRLLLAPLGVNQEALRHDPLGLSELVLQGLHSDVDRRTGLFASPDGRAVIVLARPVGDVDRDHGARLHRDLQRIRSQVRSQYHDQVELQFTGAPIYAHHFAATMRHDLTLSSLVSLGGVLLLLLIFFRSFRLLPLAGLIGGLAVGWTLALAVLAGVQLNVLSLSFAALCIGMGMDGLVHITAHTRELAGDRVQRVVASTTTLMPALLAATFTTIVTFLCFTLSSFSGLMLTGRLAACGLGLTLLLTLLLAPALGAAAPPGWHAVRDRLLEAVGNGVQAHRGLCLVLAAAAAVVALFVARGLTFSDDLTRLAPADFPPARTDVAIARHFERSRHRLIVLCRAASQEQALQANDALGRVLSRLRRQGRVASYRSLSGILPSRRTQRLRRARSRTLDPPGVVQRLQQALEQGGLQAHAFAPFYAALRAPRELTPGRLPGALRSLVQRQLQYSRDRWVVATLVYPAAGARLEPMRQMIERLDSPRATVRVTGAALAGRQMARLLGRDLTLISLLCLAAVLVVLALLLRRIRPVAAALLSLLWTAVTFAGLIRALGYDLDLYDLMVLPVLIGYGVDDHLYVVKHAVSHGTRRAVVYSGGAVLATTLTSMVAFGSLLLCDLDGLRSLGATAVLGLGLSLVGALVVMPALMGDRRAG